MSSDMLLMIKLFFELLNVLEIYFTHFINSIAKPNRTPVVNSFREWVIRRKDLNIAEQDTHGPICLKLRPDGTWENETIPCN